MAKQTTDDEALDWVVRVGDPSFEDWGAFQKWLEADPINAPRYHALSADVDDMAGLVSPEARPTVAVVDTGRISRRRTPLWLGGAVAASLALIVGYSTMIPRADLYVLETTAGAMRTAKLPDGSAVTVGGGTRLTLDRNHPRSVTLDRGQAMFSVRHDADEPFAVAIGPARVVDVGTEFDVKRVGNMTRVAVSEGTVDFGSEGRVVRLAAGQGLTARDGSAPSVSSHLDTSAIGSWRTGSLAYEGATVAEVASDLSRSLKLDLTADRSVADRPFYGSIVLADVKRDPRQIAAVLDLHASRTGDAWVLTAKR